MPAFLFIALLALFSLAVMIHGTISNVDKISRHTAQHHGPKARGSWDTNEIIHGGKK